MRTPRGEATEVRIEDVAAAEAAGYTPEVAAARVDRLGEEAQAERYDTLGGQILAGAAGTLRGATLGGSDVVASLLGSEGDVEALQQVRKYNPTTSLATEILGGAAPSLLSGGAGALGSAARLTPSGALSSAATGLTEGIAQSGAGGAARYIGGTAVGGAAEGAVQNVGSYISDVALGDKKLSAEGFLASAGQGALWGGAAGGALAGVERGTIAARRLFPKSVARDREAVQVIEDNFLAAANDTVKQGDELEKVARSAVDDLKLRSAELNLEREQLRGATDAASRIRLKEIAVEKAKLSAQRKAMRDAKNAERAATGLPDIPPDVQAPSLPPLDEASVVPTGPPANDVGAVPLDMNDPLIAQLAGTQQQLDRGVAFRDIPQSQIDDLELAAQATQHEAGMLADDAAQGGADASERLAQKTEDYAARKQAVKDWVAKYQTGSRSRYSGTMTGESLGGGAGAVRTDRTRVLPEGGVDFEAQAGDRVFARIGDEVADAADGVAVRGADLDSAYDDLIERASDAADRAELTAIAKEAGALEEQILDRVASRGGREADEVAKIRAKRAEYNWTADDVAARRAEKLAIAKTSEPVTPSAKMRAEQADLDAYERVVRGNQGRADMAHAYPKKGDLAEEILSQGEQVAGGAPTPAARNRDMGRFIADADEAIRVVGDFERAQYELAQELGSAAPPAAARHAAEYATALDDQARKATETMAAKADDIAADPSKAMALMSLPKAPTVPVDATKKAAGRIADVAGMLELINSMGDIPFLPDPKNLPVIGPILGMYLKYRGLKAVYHRLGGRVGATAEAKIATRSAEIRDKAAGIADALLEGAGKAAKKARGPAVVGGGKLLDTLKHSLYPDGQDREEQKTAAAAARARIEELSNASADPDGVRSAVRKAIDSADPDLVAAIEEATLRKLTYLQKHAPKLPTPGPLGTREWRPSTGELERFARRIRAAEDPLTVLQDVERGTVTTEAAEALREVYPALFSEVQMRLLGRAAELEAKLPYQRVMHLSILFDAPLDDSLRPPNLLRLQSAHASSAQAGQGPQAAGPQQAPPAPSVAGPVNLARLYETPGDRRASRR
jgi:hypothetical protein